MSWSWFWQSSDVFTTFSLKYNKNCSDMDLFWKVVNMVCSTSWAPARWWQSFFYKFLCFTGSQDNSGWNGSQEVIQSNFLLKVVSIKRSDQVTQGFIQLHLGSLHRGRLNNFSRQSAPLLDCPHGEKSFFSYIQYEPLLFELKHVSSSPPTTQHCEEPGITFC